MQSGISLQPLMEKAHVVGGTVKHLVRRASLQAVMENHILTPRDFCIFEKIIKTVLRHGTVVHPAKSAALHGSMLVVSICCTICPYSRKWRSQPMIRNLPAGNLLLSSSILYSSVNPTKALRMLNHLNVQGITKFCLVDTNKIQ